MTELQTPQFLIDEVAKLGVQLNPIVVFDPESSLMKLSSQFNGDNPSFGEEDMDIGAEFGFWGPLKRVFKPAQKKLTVALSAKATTPAQLASIKALENAKYKIDIKKSATGLAKGIGTGVAIASFVIPGAGPLVGGGIMAGLAAADKLLGDPNIKGAAKIISNTKALAALGDPGAKRGAIMLSAAQTIRTAKKTPPGKKAIPYSGTISTKKYTKKITQPQANALAYNKMTSEPKLTLWVKVKKWLGFKV